MSEVEKLAEMIKKSSRTVYLTGAGFSTESGISDYRSKGGIWDQFKPVTIDEFMSSRDARIRYWQYKSEFFRQMENAVPNSGHLVLSRMYHNGMLECVITQNIDGLHQAGGMPDDAVIELHGTNLRARCMSCSKTFPIKEIQLMIDDGDPAPECSCGGFIKPDTISFGQALRKEILEKAYIHSSNADLFIAAGSTLIVHPAASLPSAAAENGAFTAVINLSDTPYDSRCDLLIRDTISSVMAEVEKLLF
jgi:NAD-dependent deacetylase